MSEVPKDPYEKLPFGSERIGNCDCCPADGVRLVKTPPNMWMCDECRAKEIAVAMQHQTPELQEERLQAHKNMENVHLMHVRQENAALKIATDIFNAKIKSIDSLKKAIDEDTTIENKHFTLAQVLGERFDRLTEILHSKRQEIVEAENEQRAIQSYYNELSKKLHTQEREKIKLADLTYKPEIRTESKPKPEPKAKNYDKTGIAAQALITGLSDVLIQMTCVGRNVTPEMAVKLLNEQNVWGNKQVRPN